ncbi:MAG: glycerophosphodiester phosphodiesterase family protein [Clostridia bacterium]
MFTYIPKKSKEIYKEIIAHRGYHFKYPENTLKAYEEASKNHLAIELDVRQTLDKYIVCIHDRHTKRLLGVRGKTSNETFKTLRKYTILNSKERVPTLSEVLDVINNTTILIEVKGNIDSEFREKLKNVLKSYTGKLYFHSKNLLTYYKLKDIWGKKVFWILNPFRKRFRYIKTRDYKNNIEKILEKMQKE